MTFCAFLWLTVSTASAQSTVARKKATAAPFEAEIAAFEKWDRQNSFPKNAVLFVGSSSIRMWETAEAFPQFPVINRGFGGSTIADANYFFHRIVAKYVPRAIVFYSGDNDIAGGKSPKRVYEDFREFAARVHESLPTTPLYFISIKPSIARKKFWTQMKEVNASVQRMAGNNSQVIYVDVASPMLNGKELPAKSLFLGDGLHLNAEGYALWNKTLAPHLEKALKAK